MYNAFKLKFNKKEEDGCGNYKILSAWKYTAE